MDIDELSEKINQDDLLSVDILYRKFQLQCLIAIAYELRKIAVALDDLKKGGISRSLVKRCLIAVALSKDRLFKL